MLRRPVSSSSNRWNKNFGADEDSHQHQQHHLQQRRVDPLDEFQREFQSPHLLAQHAREQRAEQIAQSQRGGRRMISTMGSDSSVSAQSQFDAPPTSPPNFRARAAAVADSHSLILARNNPRLSSHSVQMVLISRSSRLMPLAGFLISLCRCSRNINLITYSGDTKYSTGGRLLPEYGSQ